MGAIAYVAAAFFFSDRLHIPSFLPLRLSPLDWRWRKGEPKKPLLLSLFSLSLPLLAKCAYFQREEERGGGGEVMDQLSLSLLSFLSCGLPPLTSTGDASNYPLD